MSQTTHFIPERERGRPRRIGIPPQQAESRATSRPAADRDQPACVAMVPGPTTHRYAPGGKSGGRRTRSHHSAKTSRHMSRITTNMAQTAALAGTPPPADCHSETARLGRPLSGYGCLCAVGTSAVMPSARARGPAAGCQRRAQRLFAADKPSDGVGLVSRPRFSSITSDHLSLTWRASTILRWDECAHTRFGLPSHRGYASSIQTCVRDRPCARNLASA